MSLRSNYTDLLQTLIFNPDIEGAKRLAAMLEERLLKVRVALSAEDALQSAKEDHFRTILVVADLREQACLQFLDALRHVASRSWLLAINRELNRAVEMIARRHGIDAVVETPIDVDHLTYRIECLRVRARPSI